MDIFTISIIKEIKKYTKSFVLHANITRYKQGKNDLYRSFTNSIMNKVKKYTESFILASIINAYKNTQIIRMQPTLPIVIKRSFGFHLKTGQRNCHWYRIQTTLFCVISGLLKCKITGYGVFKFEFCLLVAFVAIGVVI